MDQPNLSQIEKLEKKIDDIQRSVNMIKKVFLWTVILSVVLFVLPLIGLFFVIPKFLSMYSGYGNLLP